MISVDEARDRVLQEARALPVERLPLEASAGRALGESLIATSDLPPFDDSSMDGYALRAADLAGAAAGGEVVLPVVLAVHAGEQASRALEPGECARIFTGAPLPPGADAVVMQERVEVVAGGARFTRTARPGENVRGRGVDVRAGATVIAAGASIGPGEIALLAAQGHAYVSVHRRPRVAILATGDELREIGEDRSKGHIVSSSSYALCAAVRDAGGEPSLLGLARDDRADTRRRIEAGLDADVLLTTGGVSVGDRDLVKDALGEAACQERFWKVAIKPGKPIYFAVGPRGTLVFGLPGNPISTMVCFEVFVRPALRRLAGHATVVRAEVEAVLERGARKEPGRREYLRARVRATEAGELRVMPLEQQSSGALSSMVGVNGLAVLPEGAAELAAGDTVRVLLLDLPYV